MGSFTVPLRIAKDKIFNTGRGYKEMKNVRPPGT